MGTPYNQVSKTAQRALEEFSDEFRGALALGDVVPWAQQLGLVRTTDALKTTFPIPLDAAGYKEVKGDIKFRTLYHRSLSMKSKEWFDGVEAKAIEVEAPDFVDWAGQPAAMAFEWQRQPNLVVASLLAEASLDGPLLDFYRDEDSGTASTIRLFAAGHPYNVLKTGLGTFDNRLSCTIAEIQSGAAFDKINDHFRSILGPNGKPMGLRFSGGHILAPSTRENVFKKFLEQDTLIEVIKNATGNDNVAAVTQSNLYKGTVGYTIADELEDQDHFYAFAAGRPGLYPWAVQVSSAPEEIIHDKSSELYKRSRKIGVAYVGMLNAAMALPHPIARVKITG